MRIRLSPRSKLSGYVLKTLSLVITLSMLSTTVLAQTDVYRVLQTPFYDPNDNGSQAIPGSTDSCLSLLLPPINDSSKIAQVIDDFITSKAPTSPMKGLGVYIVSTSEKNNINPFVVASIANQESTFATGGGVSGYPGGFNAFGRSASSEQPSFYYPVSGGPDTWYKWSSWQDSVNDDIFPQTQSEQNYLNERYINQGITDLKTFIAVYLTGDPNALVDGAGNYVSKYYENVSSWVSQMVASSGSAISCGSGSYSGIVQTALSLAWPNPPNTAPDFRDPLVPKPEYTEAMKQYNPAGLSLYNGADCGVFVATVMRASGADPNYPTSGTWLQEDYVKGLPEKYEVIQTGPNDTTAILQPGDILIVNANGGAGANGHTLIYVGPQASGYNQASASFQSRMANLNTIASLLDPSGRGYYLIARLK